jgi:hypothetical protein
MTTTLEGEPPITGGGAVACCAYHQQGTGNHD